jgi:hypothetical protein
VNDSISFCEIFFGGSRNALCFRFIDVFSYSDLLLKIASSMPRILYD